MNKIKGFFTKKSFIYGSGSVAVTAIFIIIMIVLNLITDLFVSKFPIKIDLTSNKIFELSEETKTILKNLNTDIKVTMFYNLGEETPEIKEILERFAKASPKITLETIDPVKNPILVQKYSSLGQNISLGSFLFECGNSSKILSESDLFATNPLTNQKDMLVAEGKFTSAILTVQNQNPGNIAIINGHGEMNYDEAVALLKNENYKVNEVDTKAADISEDTHLAFIISPQVDFTSEEINKLDKYLKSGKNLQVYLDVQTPKLPKLEEYLSEWGIVFERNLIIEGDAKNIFTKDPTFIVPVLQGNSDITEALISNKIKVQTPIVRSITSLGETVFGTTLQSIMKTTDKSFAKSSENITDYAKESSDKAGPFDIAVMATKEKGKILAVGTSLILHKSTIESNKDLFINSIKVMTNNEKPVSISPKSLAMDKLEMSGFQIQMWTFITVILIPLIVLILGIFVWSRRRHL